MYLFNQRSHREAATVQKTAAARVRAAAECIEEPLTSLTAFLNNSLIDSLRLAERDEPSQAEHLLAESARLAV